MSAPIVSIDRSRIRPGKLEPLKHAIDDLVAFIEEQEPQLLAYGFYLEGIELYGEPTDRMLEQLQAKA